MVDYSKHVDDLAYAHGEPSGTARIRQQAEDFNVNEELSFEPSGEGEHEFVYLAKTNLNTEDVVKILAKHADVPRRSVSFAGMKDRQAVTKQWFSIQLPGQTGPDWRLLEDSADIRIVKVTRHSKKLKRGAIKYNQFELILSEVVANKEDVETRIERVKKLGAPNYFMQQRFGYLSQNLNRAYELFAKKEPMRNKKTRGFFLSSARSYLFNEVSSQRVGNKTWDALEEGDVYILNGTRQFFQDDGDDTQIQKRLLEHDIHCSGPMFGIGDSLTKKDVNVLEEAVFENNAVFCDGLKKAKMDIARRSLRVVPQEFEFEWLESDRLRLVFKLPSGSYATAIIREIIKATDR